MGSILNATPATVEHDQDFSFWGAGDAFSLITEEGVFSLGFQVDSVQYRGMFNSSGEMVACMRV